MENVSTKRLIYLIALFVMFTLITACDATPIKEAIIGKWVNGGGGAIEFRADGTGVIPAVGDIPAYSFNYTFKDDSHIELNMVGLTGSVVEIRITGDQMTWINQAENVQFVYSRAK
ncbi:MAG: hypothetical protein U0528_12805 [Anaerolineae bacterium]